MVIFFVFCDLLFGISFAKQRLGAVVQLGERYTGSVEVESSNLSGSIVFWKKGVDPFYIAVVG